MKIGFNLGIVLLLSVWTALAAYLLYADIKDNREQAHIKDILKAGELFDNHLIYRQWAARNGGVYVPVSDHTPPNPYLDFIENREIVSQQGDTFTLVNPAYMTRQVLKMSLEQQGKYGRVISLKPLNPGNSPDSTERVALDNFAKGDSVFVRIKDTNNSRYLRYIKPLIVEKTCMKCHRQQGYEPGDIRGGLSISIPTSGNSQILKAHNRKSVIFYGLIWGSGMIILLFVLLRLRKNARKKQELQDKLLQQNERLRAANEELEQNNEEIIIQKEVIEAAEDRLSKTLNGFDDPLYVIAPDYTIEFMNNALKNQLGKDCLGESCFSAVYGFKEKCPWCVFHKLDKENPEMTYEAFNEKLGKHYQVKNVLLENNSKLTIYNDVTQIIEARNKIEESEKKYRLIAENVSDVLWITDIKSLKFTYVSPSVVQMLGYTPQELINIRSDKTLSRVSVQKMTSKLHKRVKQFKENSKSANVYFDELQQKTKSGDYIWIETSTKLYYNEKGAIEMLGVSRDISARKKLENEILQQNSKLEELNATKDKFFNIIAHDLKNPFNTILGFSELLRKKYEQYNDGKRLEMLNVIHLSGQTTQKLLENLLEWSRAQTGKIKFDPQPVKAENLVGEIVGLHSISAAAKDITLENDVSEDIVLKADERMLSTVLRNLVSNAVKFTERGGRVKISAGKTGNGMAEISVQDSGVGMDRNTVSKLFKISEKISTSGTDNEKGTGLGLLLCKEFVESHGGKINVESQPDRGSRFFFTIPRQS